MEILLAVAVMSVAVASWFLANTFRSRIRENAQQLAQARQQLAELQRANASNDTARLDRDLQDVRQYIRAQLDQEVQTTRTAEGRRVLLGGIYAAKPGAADILPSRFKSFLTELPMQILFLDSTQQMRGRFYLLWTSVNGQSLEQRLGVLLWACSSDTGSPSAGLTELRALLLALHNAGPGTLQIGPLLVLRTRDDMVGVVLTPTEASLLDSQRTLPAPEDCKTLLKDVDAERFAELGTWATTHSLG
jgi:hypothetical protein